MLTIYPHHLYIYIICYIHNILQNFTNSVIVIILTHKHESCDIIMDNLLPPLQLFEREYLQRRFDEIITIIVMMMSMVTSMI